MSSEITCPQITCPQCGGVNDPPPGERLLACAFCDATLYVDRSATLGHYRLAFLLDRRQAETALRRWMAGNETVKGLDAEASIEEMEALSFPMWMFRRDAPGGEEVVVEPAAPVPIPQVADLEVPGGRLEPYRPAAEGVREVAPTVPLETARGWLGERPGGGEPRETALVRVPLWSCRYSHRGRSYRALVEASSGAVLAAVFPEKRESPFVAVALLGLLLFGAEGLLIGDLLLKALAYAVTAIPLTLLAWWVARRV